MGFSTHRFKLPMGIGIPNRSLGLPFSNGSRASRWVTFASILQFTIFHFEESKYKFRSVLDDHTIYDFRPLFCVCFDWFRWALSETKDAKYRVVDVFQGSEQSKFRPLEFLIIFKKFLPPLIFEQSTLIVYNCRTVCSNIYTYEYQSPRDLSEINAHQYIRTYVLTITKLA